MATLIRSAHVNAEPHVLPLRHERQTLPQMSDAKNINSEIQSHQSAAETISSAHESVEATPLQPPIPETAAIEPPRLDPEIEHALMEEIRATREASVREGYDTGYQQGLSEAKQALQDQIDSTTKLFQSATEALQDQINGLDDVVVTLAFEAVCKIIGSSLIDHEGVAAIVRETISHVKDTEPITIHVAATDYHQLVKDQMTLRDGHLAPTIKLVPDDRVVLGGCLIETSGGTLDGRLETQLQQLKDALLSAKHQRHDRKDAPHVV